LLSSLRKLNEQQPTVPRKERGIISFSNGNKRQKIKEANEYPIYSEAISNLQKSQQTSINTIKQPQISKHITPLFLRRGIRDEAVKCGALYINTIMTLQEAQKSVDEWIKTYGVRYFNELTNMACLTEEVGELARVIARKYGEQSFKSGEKANLGEEMADVLWVLLCLANQTGVDLTAELKKSFEKKTQRDNKRHLNNNKLK